MAREIVQINLKLRGEIKVSRTKNASRNILWGVLNKIITLGFPFLIRTVMIYTLGIDYVGLGSLFSSILSVLSFAELGIGGALVYSMYKPMAEGDDLKVSALMNLYRKTYRMIGITILIIGLAIMPFLKYLVAGNIPAGINLQLLFLLYLLNNVAGYFLYAYKQALFTASQRVDVISKISMCIKFASSVAQIIILLVVRNYYAYVIIIPINAILNNLVLGMIADKAFPQYKCKGDIDNQEKNEIKKKVSGMVFQKIGNIILASADTIVISAFLGLKTLGIYNGYYCIITVLFGLLAVIQQALVPAIGNSIIVDSLEKNLKDLKKIHLLYMWIVIWWCSCLLGLFQPFIRLWQGSENMLSSVNVVLLVIYFFTYKMGDICWMYREAMGLWWEARFVPLVSSIANLIINLILVKFIGLSGILISSIIALVFINFPWGSKVLFLDYFKSPKEWGGYMIRTTIYFAFMITVAFATWKVCMIIPCEGVFALLFRSLICAILPNILILLVNIKNKEFKEAAVFVIKLMPPKLMPRFMKGFYK